MKQLKKLYLLGLLLPPALAAAGNGPEISLSFENGCGFDGPAKMLREDRKTVVKAHLGSKVIDKEKLLVPGFSGRGLHIGSRDGKGHDTVIFYRKGGLAFAGEGTMSFRVRPDDWDHTNRKNVCFVRLIAPSGESLAVVSQMTGGRSRLVASYGVVNKPGGANVRATPKTWKKGEWHHVAVTWGKGELTLYIDGKPAGSAPFKAAAEDFNNFSLGAVWGHWSPGSSTLDDVKVFYRKLDDRKIEDEFGGRAEEKVSARPCVELKLGRRTAVVDGRIDPGEYASGFAFMRLRGRNISPVLSDRQTTVFLSADAENLYWGAVSAGEDLKTAVKNRDGNVWEDDSLELYVTSGRENAGMHHFIVNSADAVYDAVIARGSEDKNWDCRGLRVRSLRQGKMWSFEAAIPWKEIGISPGEGQSFLFNVCRTFVGVRAVDKNYAYDRNASSTVWTSVSPGPYADRRFFARAVFAPAAPAFFYAPFENVYTRNIDSHVNVSASSAPDTVTLTARIDGKPKFHVEQSQNIPAGKTASFSLKGEVAREGILKSSLASKNHGTLFAAEIPYFKSSSLLYHSIFTRLDKNQLVFVTECRDAGGRKCGVSLRMTEWGSGREVFKARETVTTVRGRNLTAFDVSGLSEGLFRIHYELSDASGKVFAKDTEYYVNYRGNPPWHGTPVGAEDVVPVPWTAPEFGKDGFSCWGRSHKFGGKGVLSSLKSSGRELLSRPVRLILDGRSIEFVPQLVKAGKGYADYLLVPADKKLPLKISVRAEFDGFMWFDIVLDGKGFRIGSLRLEVPLDRRHVIAVDDNSSANVKYDITSWTSRSYSKNPVFDPFWWIGGESFGVMGGVESCCDWHFKHKSRGLVYAVTPKEVTVTFNFVDTPFTL
ncbi:MAG: hypothetical protein IJU70_07335, partial [Lentisphaeria bacterium]|nr:hypothetical protein [Lentisphaeria bacterium]